MKKYMFIVLLMLGVWGADPVFAAGFPADQIQIMAAREITVLADEKLLEAYIDVLVEMDATKAFHATSGFTPKEYARYKELLKYRLLLRFEIHRRKLELPPEVN